MSLYEPGELKISQSFSEVGDTLNTDIELAVRSGARSLLVLSHLEHETKRRSETFWAYLLCFKYFVLKHVMHVVQKDLYVKMYVCVHNSCYMHIILYLYYVYITYMCVIILLYKIYHFISFHLKLHVKETQRFAMRPFRWCHQSQWFGEAEGNNSLSHLGGWKPCTYLDDELAWLKGNPSEKMSKPEVDASMNRIMTAPLEFDSWRHGQLKATMFCTSPWEGKGARN